MKKKINKYPNRNIMVLILSMLFTTHIELDNNFEFSFKDYTFTIKEQNKIVYLILKNICNSKKKKTYS